tara:strand:- start:2722 stop:3153 length:432 start_codon:yes stop_codon:yes gene_type:complete
MKSNFKFNTWFPFHETNISKMTESIFEFDKAMDNITSPYWREAKNIVNKPVIDYNVNSNEKGHTLQIAIPGIKKDQVSVTATDGQLHVKIDSEDTQWTKNTNRKFSLPDDANVDAITAEVEDGILNISIDKIVEAKPKEIKIL